MRILRTLKTLKNNILIQNKKALEIAVKMRFS